MSRAACHPSCQIFAEDYCFGAGSEWLRVEFSWSGFGERGMLLKGSSCNQRRHSTKPLGSVPEAGEIYKLMRAAKVKNPNVMTRALVESLENPWVTISSHHWRVVHSPSQPRPWKKSGGSVVCPLMEFCRWENGVSRSNNLLMYSQLIGPGLKWITRPNFLCYL